ncbi:hypothetical protein D3C71_936980 [compost metagenome]
MLGIGIHHVETVHAQKMIAAQAGVFVQCILVVQVKAVDGVGRPALFRPIDALGRQVATNATVQRFNLQSAFRSEMHAFFGVIDPHVQMILFLAYALAGQGDAHAHQAVRLVIAFGIA